MTSNSREKHEWLDLLMREVDRVCHEEGISHNRFAKTAGLHTPTLHAYKTGNSTPTVEKLSLICTRCGTTPNRILGFQDDEGGALEEIKQIVNSI